MPSKLSLPRQGPWNWVWVKQVFELSEVELTEFHCTFFHQLRHGMGQHFAPPFSEAYFCFELIRLGGPRNHNGNPPWPLFKHSSSLLLAQPAICHWDTLLSPWVMDIAPPLPGHLGLSVNHRLKRNSPLMLSCWAEQIYPIHWYH